MKEFELEQETAMVEAVLFLESDPLDYTTLMRYTELPRAAVEQAVQNLMKKYKRADSGIEIIQLGGGFVLTPRESLWEFLRKRYGKKNDNRLSRAAIETLSIIAYSQPITKGEIENLRGVSADGMIKLLLSRNLIRVSGKKDIPGKPVQYSTTLEFLKLFRLNSIADLPRLDELESERFELNG